MAAQAEVAEKEEEVETFEASDAGAAMVIPMEAGQVKKGGHIVIKGRPCKVESMSMSKTGKHGHAKINFIARDIFNFKKQEDMCPSTHALEVPNVSKSEWMLTNVEEDDSLVLMDDNG